MCQRSERLLYRSILSRTPTNQELGLKATRKSLVLSHYIMANLVEIMRRREGKQQQRENKEGWILISQSHLSKLIRFISAQEFSTKLLCTWKRSAIEVSLSLYPLAPIERLLWRHMNFQSRQICKPNRFKTLRLLWVLSVAARLVLGRMCMKE